MIRECNIKCVIFYLYNLDRQGDDLYNLDSKDDVFLWRRDGGDNWYDK